MLEPRWTRRHQTGHFPLWHRGLLNYDLALAYPWAGFMQSTGLVVWNCTAWKVTGAMLSCKYPSLATKTSNWAPEQVWTQCDSIASIRSSRISTGFLNPIKELYTTWVRTWSMYTIESTGNSWFLYSMASTAKSDTGMPPPITGISKSYARIRPM